MMAKPSSQQADRVLLLLFALLRIEGGLTRAEIYEQVPAYEQAPSQMARNRVFERDMQILQGSPFEIEIVTTRGGQNSIYACRKEGLGMLRNWS